MSVVNAWQGAATSNSIRVRAKVTGASTRLLVADNPALTGPAVFGPVTPVDDIATLDATGLDPNTRYWWAVEDDDTVDDDNRGTFRTHPVVGEPASFSFAAATCAGSNPDTPGVGAVLASDRLSNHIVFDTIRNKALTEDILFFAHIGDLHYYDLGSDDHGIVGGGSLDNYLRAYDDVLLQPHQHRLYREVPLVYSAGAGGHDYGQPIGLARTLPGRNNQLQAWRTRVPDYPTADPSLTAGTYRSFQVGRVLFIVTEENADRDPDSDPDDANKTKLGAAQKAWMEQTLATTSAEVLVWLSGAQWERGGSANWGRYTTERAEIQAMLGDLGWLDRMVFITGDRHALEIVEAGDNPFGGFPIWHFASLDCPPTGVPGPPGLPGNNQYGTVSVVDDGSQITITGSGWVGQDFWDSDVLTVETVTPPPTPPPDTEPLPPVAQAAIRTRVTWLACRLGDGRIIAELPDLQGTVSRVIGRYTETSLNLPIPRSGPGAVPLELIRQATQPARAMAVAVVNDIPMWAGILLPRKGGTDATLQLGAVSIEGYLEHRFVRDHTWTQQDEASVIAAGLLGDAGDLAGVGSGIGLVIDAPGTGRLRDRTYLATDHATTYRRLTELMAVENGPEWTIDPDWTDTTHTAVQLIARVRAQLGTASSSPSAVFETTADSVFSSLGSSDARYDLLEDYSGDRYGNYVVAYSSGEGEDQPVSTPAIDTEALAAGAPIWERHFQPASDITTQSVLDEHARAELARIKDGTVALAITARWATYPRYGVDWQLGDVVGWQLVGHWHPEGLTGQGRVIGMELDTQAGTIRPILQEEA